jgi:hypothetical protein
MLEESIWRDKYETLDDYYAEEFKQTYKILHPETLLPVGDEEFPCYTLEDIEKEIDPDENPEQWNILETDSPQVKKYKTAKHREEIKKCINSFPYFCHRYVKIVHPMRGLINFVLFNYQRRVIKEYDEHRFNIISKMRQAGLTTVTAIWGLWRCMFKKQQIIMVMSKTDREAMTAAQMIANAIHWLPDWLRPVMGKDNDHKLLVLRL